MDEQTVFVLDDNDDLRDSIYWLLETVGVRAELYATAQEFVESYVPEKRGCIVLDIRMPGMSGLELLEWLHAQNVCMPVIIISGHGDIPTAIRAIKSGALDFLEKPFNGQDLLDRVQNALRISQEMQQKHLKHSELNHYFDSLTNKEKIVLNQLVTGKSSKIIGRDLGISPKTVDVHRTNIMKKLRVHGVKDLINTYLSHKYYSDRRYEYRFCI